MVKIAPQSHTINELQARLRTETRQKKAAIALYQFFMKLHITRSPLAHASRSTWGFPSGALAPLNKGGTGKTSIKVPLLKGDLGGSRYVQLHIKLVLLDNANLKYQLLLKSYISDMTKQNDRTKINFKRILLLVGLGGLPLGILTIFIQVPPSCGCSNSSKNTIGSFIRAQQAYFSEKSVFAQSYSLLELGDGDAPAATTYYRYSVEMGKNKSFIYATPTKELPTDLLKLGLTKKGFNSLVGAVASDKTNKTTVSIMCGSEKKTLDKPPKPVFKQAKFSCPIGFKTIN